MINLNENMPKHIGIIMDGNGRWAKAKGMKRTQGHKQGVETLKKIGQECIRLNVPYLTVYAFSTENWKRPEEEVNTLWKLIEIYLVNELKKLHKEGVRIRTIGDTTKLPQNTYKKLQSAIDLTQDNTKLTLTIALNYGARADIVLAIQKITEQIQNKEIDIQDITDELVSKNLSTNFLPDPDLIIRPSGEFRLSNFLMWESAYSELWFADINWPDFTEENLHQAIYDYQNRDRRFGNAK